MSNAQRSIDMRAWPLCYVTMVVGSWCLNYPGRLNPDSYDMLVQARLIDTLNNWHSPVVTWLWTLVSPPLEQPSGALLVQCVLLFGYPAALLVDAKVSRPLSAIFALGLIPLSGFISKDVVFVAVILSALGGLDYLRGSSRTWAIGVCSAIALLVRPTNFVIFAVAACVGAAYYQRGWRLFQSIVLAVSMSLVAVPVTGAINKHVFGAKDAFPEQSLIMFDIAGMSTVLRRDLFAPLPLWSNSALPQVSECFTPLRWDPFAK